jgi:LuxR family maltose regulon positive regulatory protein
VLVARRRLFEALDGAGRVTQLSASAGTGKTSLLRAWIADRGIEASTAWITVGTEERDAHRFWLSVLAAVRQTDAGSRLAREITPAPGLDAGAIVERLLADLSELREPMWLVLDDLHELRSDTALRLLELFLMRAPAELRFVSATRRDLRLGLHRLRLEGLLTEIRAADLRFSVDESRALFATAGVDLSGAAVALLADRTEGWAAGLRLAALSLSGHEDPESFAAEFAGSERTVAEYLVAEVLDRQPEDVRRLLIRTSVLDRVSGSLADLLAGGSDGQAILQELEEAGAFVVAVDSRRRWFRYHHLFADLLRRELLREAPSELRSLHAAAASWFAERGHTVEAIRHAQEAEQWNLASRLLLDNWFGLLLGGQAAQANELVSVFPASLVAGDPELRALLAARELDRGSPDEAERHLDEVQGALASYPADRRDQLQLMLAILRLSVARHRGDLRAVVAQGRGLLAPAEAPDAAQRGLGDDLRALALLEFGVAELWTGGLDAATRHLEHALVLGRRSERPFLVLSALAHLAQIEIFESLRLGEARSKEAIDLAEQHGWEDDPVAGVAYTVHGMAMMVHCRIGDAESLLRRAENTRLPWVSPAGGLMLYVLRGLIDAVRGRDADALRAFQAADRLRGLLVGSHLIAARIPGHLVRTFVGLGELEQADAVLAGLDQGERALPEIRIAEAALRLARDDPAGATNLLAPLVEDQALAMRPQVWPAQAVLLEAIARDAMGDSRRRAWALERALDLAEPEGLVAPFLLFPALGMLERHRRRGTSHPALLAQIVDLLAGGRDAPGGGAPEPLNGLLTEGETRVLRYLPTNLSAPEIAGELGLSLNTIRTHMRHLYTKLGVHTRADAVERARGLALLAPSLSRR